MGYVNIWMRPRYHRSKRSPALPHALISGQRVTTYSPFRCFLFSFFVKVFPSPLLSFTFFRGLYTFAGLPRCCIGRQLRILSCNLLTSLLHWPCKDLVPLYARILPFLYPSRADETKSRHSSAPSSRPSSHKRDRAKALQGWSKVRENLRNLCDIFFLAYIAREKRWKIK